jgi:endoglucanase
VDGRSLGAMTLGGGPVLVRGANANPVLVDLLRQAAQQNDVPCQTVGTPGATGTDAKVIQLSRCGVATALIRVPLRYMHSPVEVLSLADVENTVRLITAALPAIAACPSFIPL